MKTSTIPTVVALAAALTLSACSSTSAERGPDLHTPDRAQVFERMGPHARTVSTQSPEAQMYFDQGLTWMYAFNHDEAIRSFAKAAEIDPTCAMAWWGVALCQGPNYNDPVMTEARSEAAWAALQQALAHIDDTTPVERALIEALATRYAAPWPEDRSELEQAYADAMGVVYEAFPDDSDVGTLYAESLMVLRPWQLYDLEFHPAPDTERIVAVLEGVMERDPDNPGANHLYIHAVEPSADPDRGIPAADRLSDLVQASGHLEHMPSHIYVKTGMWARAIEQNEKAMAADELYRELSPDQTIQHMYMVHNSHMLAYAAMMCGRETEGLAAARSMWRDIPPDMLPEVAAFVDLWMASVYDVQKRFGRWDDILAEEAPPEVLPITNAVWRAHRAIAYAAKQDFENAEREQELFAEAKAAIPEESVFGGDGTHTILEVSEHFIAAEIALQKGDHDTAIAQLLKAAEVEDTLSYGEPPQWLQPVRHTLGAVYLTAGQPAEAERVYREDLAKWRANGWSLYGLMRALQEQGKDTEAAEVQARFEAIWAQADEPLTSSCKCIPVT